ncbi:putative SOS response-associated peptidase YedK [Maribacter spongiicola]|uniref:Abasic site processing protein n=1 Tax=Maribacter spongiicola TaxID=1206753 RepID=A0A4R7K8V0_9FLAO|nr:SOS response-associated peptidase [Maribacter spongiicola]TDT47132.1 putative SOS response-associated peptidase YedK [Maribacter spongiicola]
MCYDVKTSLEAQLKRAKRSQDLKAIEEIVEKLGPLTDLPLHHASGFSHPEVLIYTNDDPFYPIVATWGLIPHWVNSAEQQKKIWNSTLNARVETIFEKPAFKDAANEKRCMLYVDGFYEHHHYNDNTYPFFIHRKNNQPLALAALWSEWIHPEHGGTIKSFSIVTTVGNGMMSKIHNNAKLKEPRMPLMLSEDLEEQWLSSNADFEKELTTLLNNDNDLELKAHTVGKLRGKNYAGNIASISDEVVYTELEPEELNF